MLGKKFQFWKKNLLLKLKYNPIYPTRTYVNPTYIKTEV